MPETVISLLQKMVQTPSVNGSLTDTHCAEQALVDWLASLVESWSLQTMRFPMPEEGQADQLLVWVDETLPRELPGDREPSGGWLFESHLDTVGIEGMTIDPFAGELKEGKVYGRGACDTKGTGAAMLWALKQYAQQEDRPHPVGVLFTIDEEVGMTGIEHFVKHDFAKLPFKPKAIVIGEPTQNMPIIAHLGVMRIIITTTGIAAHSAIPSLGESAISPMVKIVQALEAHYIPTVTAEHPVCGSAACSINMIHGGQSPNVIPDQCTISMDRRTAPGETPEEVLAAIKAVLDQTGCDYDMQCTVSHPSFPNNNNTGLVEQIQAILKEQGLPTHAFGVPFCTHASYLAETNVPCVVLGPGDALQAHQKDEWVAADAIEQGVQVYLALMQTSPNMM